MAKVSQPSNRRSFLMEAAATVGAVMGASATLGAAREQKTPGRQKKAARLKITKIKTYKFNVNTGQSVRDPSNRRLVSSSFKTWLFLKIETNTELYGWGEGSTEWLSPVIETTLRGWEELPRISVLKLQS